MSDAELARRDCHYHLRLALLALLGDTNPEDFLCFSIAWDWMYRGVTSEGVCREAVATLECASLNRLHMKQSLAIPELALLQMARTMTPVPGNPARDHRLSKLAFTVSQSKIDYEGYMPSADVILRGILPALRYVVDQHASAIEKAEDTAKKERSKPVAEVKRGPRVTIANRPNSWENPQVSRQSCAFFL